MMDISIHHIAILGSISRWLVIYLFIWNQFWLH